MNSYFYQAEAASEISDAASLHNEALDQRQKSKQLGKKMNGMQLQKFNLSSSSKNIIKYQNQQKLFQTKSKPVQKSDKLFVNFKFTNPEQPLRDIAILDEIRNQRELHRQSLEIKRSNQINSAIVSVKKQTESIGCWFY